MLPRYTSAAALLGSLLAALAVPASASAAPKVSFKLTSIPIPGFPHTGNIYGAGAAGKFEFTIKGSEYDEGHPAPLVGINVYFPKRTRIHSAGFPTCSKSALEAQGENAIGSSACPKKSLLTFPISAPQPESPHSILANESYALGVVRFGKEITEEKSRIIGVHAPGKKLYFYSKGVTPAAFELISTGSVSTGSTPTTKTEVPLVETVPGAADASVERIVVYAGGAYKKGKKTTYYATMPPKGSCPKHGFPVKAVLTFANIAALPNRVAGETVTATYKAPCPRR